MLGSHNSFSYLPIKGWKKILKPWIACQNLNIKEQYFKGINYFDIRVRWYKGTWWICHNTALFVSLDKVSQELYYLGRKQCTVRLVLDMRKEPKDAQALTYLFYTLQEYLVDKYNLRIDSRIIFWQWKEYNAHYIKQEEYHNSVISPWYKYILGNKHFAKKYNNTYVNKEKIHDEKTVYLVDYIQL